MGTANRRNGLDQASSPNNYNDWALAEKNSKTVNYVNTDGTAATWDGKMPTDEAKAIAWDDSRKEIVVLLEVQSLGLRPDWDEYADASIKGEAPS